jgi:hypothetical protein
MSTTAAKLLSRNNNVNHNHKPAGPTVKVTATAGSLRLRPIAPYVPFPVDILPPVLARFVSEGALAIGCDSAFLALPVLSVCAGLIGNRRRVKLKRRWSEPAVVWTAAVADSGTQKSSAYDKAVDPVKDMQRRLTAEYSAKLREATSDGEPPTGLTLKRVLVSDTTVERLAEILGDNPLGVLLARDELREWLGGFDQYKSRGGSDLSHWLEVWRAGSVIVDRKILKGQVLHVAHAAVSITGTIQPAILAKAMTTEFRESGLAARLLIAMPPKLPKKWTECDVDPVTEAAYADLLDQLYRPRSDVDDEERPLPLLIPLSPDAKRAWVTFYHEWAEVQNEAQGEQASTLAKLEAYAVRLALLHHTAGLAPVGGAPDITEDPIDLESLNAGVAMARWFAAEADRVSALMAESGTPEADGRQVLDAVGRRPDGRITVRELQRSNQRRFPDAESARAALDGLVAADKGRWVREPTPGGGHTVEVFELERSPV